MEPSSKPQAAIGIAVAGSQEYPAPAYPPAATIIATPAAAASDGFTSRATICSQPWSNECPAPYYVTSKPSNSTNSSSSSGLNDWLILCRPLTSRTNTLPLVRIKKIMKAGEDVRKISEEAPVVFAKLVRYPYWS